MPKKMSFKTYIQELKKRRKKTTDGGDLRNQY